MARTAGRIPGTAAERVVVVLERLLGAPVPVRVRAWDGSVAGPADDGPVLVFTSRRAVRRLLWQPDEMGLGRAWVAGEVEVDGDLEEVLRRLAATDRDLTRRRVLTPGERSELVRASVLLGAVGPQPKPPPEEVSLVGDADSAGRDAAAVRHHQAAGTDFFSLVLGDSLAHQVAALGSDGPADLAEAQRLALERTCAVLGLGPGDRLLDVGCGWGALTVHAAVHHGVQAVGLTLSREQAETARKRAADAGVGDQVDIRVQGWREVDDGPYDAVAAVDAAGFVGARAWPELAQRIHDQLAPGGRLLVEQVFRRPGPPRPGGAFTSAYVLPDRTLPTLAELVDSLEHADLEVRRLDALREEYAATVSRWAAALAAHRSRAEALAGVGRVRAWEAFLAGSVVAADTGTLGVAQLLVVRRHADGRAPIPSVRAVADRHADTLPAPPEEIA
jgi:cyclopropane-fatty-acyl-phospholipid synthase